MATDLQVLYDRFFSKVDEDFSFKEGQVFSLVDSAIAKSYKTVVHDLSYDIIDSDTYKGHFLQDLNYDEIELLALWMVYEWNRKKQQRLIGMRIQIGTKDFNKLADKPKELDAINKTMKLTMDDINDLKNEFNTYSY